MKPSSRRVARTIRSLAVPAILACAAIGDPLPLKVHMLSGSEEYSSDTSLAVWSKHLADDYGITATFSRGPDKATEVLDLDQLDAADVLVVFCRRWELGGEQAGLILNWIKSGKSILGVRTASHAFEFYREFDQDVLGGDYSGHGEDGVDMQVVLNPEQIRHPVLKGVSPWRRTGKLYRNPDLAPDVTVLLTFLSSGNEEPLAWVRLNESQRVFYTSMGLPSDFEEPTFIQLLDNALFWVTASALGTDSIEEADSSIR